MTVEVITYNNPRKWEEHEYFNKIKDEIHICATKNVADGITERYSNNRQFKYVFTINKAISKFFSEWNRPERIMGQYLTLSKKIKYEIDDDELRSAFKKNALEVLDTIRFLVFCGVNPQDFKFIKDQIDLEGNEILSDKEKVLGDIWFKLEEDDPIYRKIRRYLSSKISLDKAQRKLGLSKQKKIIVLHGFYYVTPEQQVFLKFLERSGFKIVFFQYHDNRFPNTFDFNKAFISQKNGWTDNWIYTNQVRPENTLGTNFLNTFELGKKKTRENDNEVVEYEDFFDFLQDVIVKNFPIGEEKKYNDKVQIIATNADILNELLVQYYPEKFANQRNFLSYPVGQFMLKIHEIHDGNDFKFDEDILVSCFSSGWLKDDSTGKNAQDYTYILQQLLPYFSDCRSVDKWFERIDKLIDQYDKILPLFEDDNDSQVIKSLRNPLSKMTHFSFHIKEIKQVKNFFVILNRIANQLFDINTEETSIKIHFERLSELVDQYNPVKNNVVLEEEEKRLISKLSRKISEIDYENEFLYEDIDNAIQFYLSGKFSDDEEDAFITKFIELDGEVFKDKVQKLYITGLDERGLPVSKFDFPWPFSEDTFTHLANKRNVLELNLLRNTSVRQISRYLLFLALEFLWDKETELSWISNFLDRENLQPSIYVDYLDLKIKSNRIEGSEIQKDIKESHSDLTFINVNQNQLERFAEEMAYDDILVEYELCPKRFYFGYLLDEKSTFSDDFMHQFLYSEMIKLVKQSTNLDSQKVIELVSELFPQWNKYQKDNIAETALKYTKKTSPSFESVDGKTKINTQKRNFQLPGLRKNHKNKLYKSIAKNKTKNINKIIESKDIIMEAKSGNHCKYCPFLDICSEGKYALD